ncbi:hypothetical protein [Microvirga sp. CF3016]|uniref:hypothetical protein n=1 Tax=Microvirga sp. CF3016 TaxID=3110181 RepID=UPI002E76F0BF|nr:hypothetical protein [Microvirga sp. CF3016]MEE1613666.1 hypothetical protein [Microvirga sp. CF3016]
MPVAEAESLTCAVLDIDLRGESGLAVAEILRRRDVPFVYSNGYNGAMVPEALKGAAHLEKPFRIEDLLHAVDRFFRERKEVPQEPG